MKVFRNIALAGACAVVLLASGAANAAGCLKGAVVGGVVGHYAGHHAVLGAVGGCVLEHHHEAELKKAKEQAARQPTGHAAS